MLDFETLHALLIESENPKAVREKYGLPHPLSKFAANGGIKNECYADILLEFLNDMAWGAVDERRYAGARWLLLESERTFFFACSEAGIDGEVFRAHLLKCDADELLPQE